MKPNPTPGYRTTEFWLTLTLNILAAVLAYLQTIDATWAVISCTVLNSIYTLARMGTKAAVERAKTAAPLILACLITAAALPSCTQLEGIPVSGTIYYRHESGAKGGLTITDGTPQLYIRLPKANPIPIDTAK